MSFQSSPRRDLAYSNLNGNGDAPSRALVGATWPAKLINSILLCRQTLVGGLLSGLRRTDPCGTLQHRAARAACRRPAAQRTTSKPTTNRRLARRLRDNEGHDARHIAKPSKRSVGNARSLLQPIGYSIIFMWSRTRFERSELISRQAGHQPGDLSPPETKPNHRPDVHRN